MKEILNTQDNTDGYGAKPLGGGRISRMNEKSEGRIPLAVEQSDIPVGVRVEHEQLGAVTLKRPLLFGFWQVITDGGEKRIANPKHFEAILPPLTRGEKTALKRAGCGESPRGAEKRDSRRVKTVFKRVPSATANGESSGGRQ